MAQPPRRQPDPDGHAQPLLRRQGLGRPLRDACGAQGRARRCSTSTRPGWSSRRRWSSRPSGASCSVSEIPIDYYPRVGESKLNRFGDAWRHVKFMLLYSPSWLYFVPGLRSCFCSGVIGAARARDRTGRRLRPDVADPHDARSASSRSCSARRSSSSGSSRGRTPPPASASGPAARAARATGPARARPLLGGRDLLLVGHRDVLAIFVSWASAASARSPRYARRSASPSSHSACR